METYWHAFETSEYAECAECAECAEYGEECECEVEVDITVAVEWFTEHTPADPGVGIRYAHTDVCFCQMVVVYADGSSRDAELTSNSNRRGSPDEDLMDVVEGYCRGVLADWKVEYEESLAEDRAWDLRYGF